jgi:hypothetical protein
MPHVDQLSLRNTWVDHGTSPFAAPVAAITHFVQSLPARGGAIIARWGAQLLARARANGRAVADWEVRRQEARYARAASLQALEHMERDFNRRQGESVRNWE